MEEKDARNLRPHRPAILAMSLFGSEYQWQSGGSMDFWDSLNKGQKARCHALLDRLSKAGLQEGEIEVTNDQVITPELLRARTANDFRIVAEDLVRAADNIDDGDIKAMEITLEALLPNATHVLRERYAVLLNAAELGVSLDALAKQALANG